MDNEVKNFYEFGPYRLDPRRNLLLREGNPVVLTSKAFETLLVLVRHSEQVVSKEELMRQVWPGMFVEDANLTQHISMVRKALGETPLDRRYIVTFPGRGYSFAEPVRIVPENTISERPGDSVRSQEPSGDSPAQTTRPQDSPANVVHAEEMADLSVAAPVNRPSKNRSFWHRSRAWAAACVALVVLGGSVVWLSHQAAAPQPKAGGAEKKVMLAVLPFANLSSNPEQEYFSDGLTEETITDLGELDPEWLGVIARTSSTAYKHTDKTIAQIGRELGVDYVLEGSVRREGGVARVSAQLIRVKDQAHLWAHTYERDAGGLLPLQSELGTAIAQTVEVKLTTSAARAVHRYTPNPEAYELYLKGRFYLNKRTWPEIDQSAEFFEQSIHKDPGFALAYAGLAASHLANAIGAPQKFDPKAKAAATRALELDENVAEAHAVLGAVKADFEYDWPGAEKEFAHAMELNPNSADAHYRYAWNYLVPLGRFDQAVAEMNKALELDPFSRIDNTILGCTFFYGRRYDQALQQFEKAIRLNPDFFVTYYHLAWLYSQLGRYPDAITALTKGRSIAGDYRVKIAAPEEILLRKAFSNEGSEGFWKELLRQESKDDPEVGEFARAQVYARLGDKENALKWLERAYDERTTLGTLMNVDPAFDSIRSDPRFRSLVKRMGVSSDGESKLP